MIKVVLDTNILVASLWKPNSKSAGIVRDVIGRQFHACFDQEILTEYSKVLRRLKFRFPLSVIESLLHGIAENGLSVAVPKSEMPFAHESDRVFYDVAVHCGAILVTSNLRHYPMNDPFIMTSGAFARYTAKLEEGHMQDGLE